MFAHQIVKDFTEGTMKFLIQRLIVVVIFCSIATSAAYAEQASFDLLASSPAGSWQLREDSDTNHKGKQTISVIKTSILGSEVRSGKTYYWIEMGIDNFKVSKKGKRKPKGKRLVVKSLIAEEVLRGESANVMQNLRGFGEEVIIQNGKKDKPMRINKTGGLMSNMMNSMGAEIRYEYKSLGSETIETAVGPLKSDKISGKGAVDMKLVFKKIRVESDSTVWISSKIPFGIIKQEGTTVTNGKNSTQSSKLLEFGMSGAVSEITKEVEDMPDLGGLLGG